MGGSMFHVSRYVSCFCGYFHVLYAISISMLSVFQNVSINLIYVTSEVKSFLRNCSIVDLLYRPSGQTRWKYINTGWMRLPPWSRAKLALSHSNNRWKSFWEKVISVFILTLTESFKMIHLFLVYNIVIILI